MTLGNIVTYPDRPFERDGEKIIPIKRMADKEAIFLVHEPEDDGIYVRSLNIPSDRYLNCFK